MKKILMIGMIVFLYSTAINAAIFTVTKTADTNDGVCSIDCSLREAIDVATNGDTIEFSTLFNSPQTIILNGTELTINEPLTINGTGADKLTIDGAVTSRVLNISGAGIVVGINRVKITRGFNTSTVDCNGGGIKITDAILNMDRSIVDFNFVQTAMGNNCFGGGIYNTGTLNLTNSTVSNNTANSIASATGGGIYNGNFTDNATATIVNSTISGNFARTNGGGINNGRTMSLFGVTITNNQVDNANGYSGINNGFISSTFITSTIVAGNQNNRDVFGNYSSQGFNLIGDGTGATGLTQPTDQVGTTTTPIDPMLGTLANNGGTTQTHLPLTGSPAIDKGNSTGASIDQRDLNRTTDISSIANAIGGDGTDIGAVEILAPTAAGITITGRVTSSNGRGLGRVLIEMSDLRGNTIYVRTNNFGYFNFSEATAGETYIFNAYSKLYQFAPQVINATENIKNLNFSPSKQTLLKKSR